MKMFGCVAAVVLSAVLVVASSPDTLSNPYRNIKVLRIPTPSDADSLMQLDSIIDSYGLERWTSGALKTNSLVDVQVKSDEEDKFLASIGHVLDNDQSAKIVTMHEDLGESIFRETQGMFDSTSFKKTAKSIGFADPAWFDTYHAYDDHIQWLSDVAGTFPNNSRVISMGTSYEGRDMAALNFFGEAGSGNRPAVVFHSTVHAREWITTMVNEYVTYELLNNYANSTDVKAIVDKFDFYILLFTNPDGFAYTQTTSRLWRKNRQPASDGTCFGRDINRNWAHSSWAQDDGASTSPCSETYKGEEPADTPENQAVSAFLDGLANSEQGVIMYLDWHSYGQEIMTPYGYSCDTVPPNNDELNAITSGFAEAVVPVYGTEYVSGPLCPTLYQVSGGSIDYAYDNSGVRYSMTIELRDNGNFGFVLPPEQIRPSGEETWVGMQTILNSLDV